MEIEEVEMYLEELSSADLGTNEMNADLRLMVTARA